MTFPKKQEDQTQQVPVPQEETSIYGGQQPIQQKPQIWQQPIQRQQDMRPVQQQVSGY